MSPATRKCWLPPVPSVWAPASRPPLVVSIARDWSQIPRSLFPHMHNVERAKKHKARILCRRTLQHRGNHHILCGPQLLARLLCGCLRCDCVPPAGRVVPECGHCASTVPNQFHHRISLRSAGVVCLRIDRVSSSGETIIVGDEIIRSFLLQFRLWPRWRHLCMGPSTLCALHAFQQAHEQVSAEEVSEKLWKKIILEVTPIYPLVSHSNPMFSVLFSIFSRFLYPGFLALLVSSISFPLGTGQFLAGELSTHEQVTQLFSNFTWSRNDLTVEQAAVVTHWMTAYTSVFGNLVCYTIFTVSGNKDPYNLQTNIPILSGSSSSRSLRPQYPCPRACSYRSSRSVPPLGVWWAN